MKLSNAVPLGLALALAAPAVRAQQPAPPSWDVLAHCAQLTDDAQELACYRAAMKAAGFQRNPEVSAAERKKSFGLEAAPKPAEKAKPPKETRQAAAPPAPEEAEDESRITTKIVEVAYTKPLNKLLMVTSDGGVWMQTDTTPLTFTPKAGQSLEIRKTRFGGYFCKFDKVNAVRCDRRN